MQTTTNFETIRTLINNLTRYELDTLINELISKQQCDTIE
jgi:hypothetical protein